jgi:hypothetical protein
VIAKRYLPELLPLELLPLELLPLELLPLELLPLELLPLVKSVLLLLVFPLLKVGIELMERDRLEVSTLRPSKSMRPDAAEFNACALDSHLDCNVSIPETTVVVKVLVMVVLCVEFFFLFFGVVLDFLFLLPTFEAVNERSVCALLLERLELANVKGVLSAWPTQRTMSRLSSLSSKMKTRNTCVRSFICLELLHP